MVISNISLAAMLYCTILMYYSISFFILCEYFNNYHSLSDKGLPFRR